MSTQSSYAGKPLIYSCSGASSAAQLSNHLAVRMDRQAKAEMSCVVGLGGDVRPLVRTARSGRPIVMIDGCPLKCGLHTLARHGLRPDLHWELSRLGVPKEYHTDFRPEDAARLLPELAEQIAALTEKTRPAVTPSGAPNITDQFSAAEARPCGAFG